MKNQREFGTLFLRTYDYFDGNAYYLIISIDSEEGVHTPCERFYISQYEGLNFHLDVSYFKKMKRDAIEICTNLINVI
jgi:hypothetical protein